MSAPAELGSRRERRKIEVRERILDAAIQLFTEQGCDTPSIEQICDRADLSRMTFYNYFASKQELVYALTEMLMIDVTSRVLDTARARNDNAIEVIRYYLTNGATTIDNYSPLERELMRQVQLERNAEVSARRFFQIHKLLTGVVAAGQRRGEISRAHSAEFFGSLVFGAMRDTTLYWIFDSSFPAAPRLLELADFFGELLKPEH